MESAGSLWQVGLIALIAGVMIGALGYRLFGRSSRESDKIQGELNATREEMTRYRADVNEHFNKTSELVNDLTQNYVRVYQHLAEGATSLGDSKTFNNLLEQHPGKMSLTVDGDADSTTPAADDRVIDAAPPAAAATPSDYVEDVSDEAPAEPPAADAAAAEETGADKADAQTAEEPVQPVEAEAQAAEAETAAEPAAASAPETAEKTASVMPEDSDKTSRTVH